MTDETMTEPDLSTYDDPADRAIDADADAEELEADVRAAFAQFEPALWRMAEAAQLRATAAALRALAEIEPEAVEPAAELGAARRDLDRLTTRLDRVEKEIRSAQSRVNAAKEREQEAVLALDIDTASASKQVARELRGAVGAFVRERRELKAAIPVAERRLSVAQCAHAAVTEKIDAARDAVDAATPSPADVMAPWLVRGLVDPDAYPAGKLVAHMQQQQIALLAPMITLAFGLALMGAQTEDKLSAVQHDPLYLRHNNGFAGATGARAPLPGRPTGGFQPAHQPGDVPGRPAQGAWTV